jgi:Tfp pilus assembly protein PilO
MKQSSKRLMSVFFAFLFVLAAFIFFFDLVQPAYQNVEALRSQQLGEANYIATQSALVKQVQAVLNTYENEAQGAANVSLALPPREDVAGALAQIEGIAANNNIAIGTVAVTPPAVQIGAGTAAASASSTGATKPVSSFTLKILATGSYESFENFISEIETNIRIFDVKDVSVQSAILAPSAPGKPATSRDAFNYALTIATYYQP